MKKYAALLAIAVLVAFAAPALAVTNPFMDVPMNHWAYDAIAQLASRGVLSGFPDGTYKGKQPTTRYEMASALARALAVVDMTKASKQDVEMLKKLVVEFKDELDALGVKVDQIDKRVAVLESRLGGWKLSGVLRQDLQNNSLDGDGKGTGNLGSANRARSRLFVDRWFGEDESMHFQARFDGDTTGGNAVTLGRFFVEFPVWWDSTITAGRFAWDMEANYYLGGVNNFSEFMGFGLDSWLTDRAVDGMGWRKSIGLGKVSAYVARPKVAKFTSGNTTATSDSSLSAWELFFMAEMQFTEQIGFDLGVQYFIGDDNSTSYTTSAGTTTPVYDFEDLFTVFAGLRFNFNENIALRGLYYYQDATASTWNTSTSRWNDIGNDSTAAYRVHLEVKQDLLKFSSLWLEYNHLEQNFVVPTGDGVVGGMFDHDDVITGNAGLVPYDLDIWRVAGQQKWNDKWTTFFTVSGFTLKDAPATVLYSTDYKATLWGLGAIYHLNSNVGMGLGFAMMDWNSDAERFGGKLDESIIRFRTQITF